MLSTPKSVCVLCIVVEMAARSFLVVVGRKTFSLRSPPWADCGCHWVALRNGSVHRSTIRDGIDPKIGVRTVHSSRNGRKTFPGGIKQKKIFATVPPMGRLWVALRNGSVHRSTIRDGIDPKIGVRTLHSSRNGRKTFPGGIKQKKIFATVPPMGRSWVSLGVIEERFCS